jgi:predicted transcriptional regulator
MEETNLDDHIRKLIHRSSLFQCLLDTPQNRAQLANQVDASRTTVYRALEELQSYGLVAFSDREFRPTPYGELLFQSLNNLRRYGEKFHKYENLLQTLPEETPVAYQLVSTGKVVESSSVNPRVPLRCLCGFINEASTIKAAAKVVYPEDAETYYRNIMSDSTDCTLILQNKLVSKIYSIYDEKFKKSSKVPTLASLRPKKTSRLLCLYRRNLNNASV